jgi:hypothetical protein
MSRSFKKTPVGNWASGSDKWWRTYAHARMRAALARILPFTALDETPDLPHRNELGNPWSWPSDGKTWYGRLSIPDKLMRK